MCMRVDLTVALTKPRSERKELDKLKRTNRTLLRASRHLVVGQAQVPSRTSSSSNRTCSLRQFISTKKVWLCCTSSTPGALFVR